MGLLVAFVVFAGSMIGCLLLGISTAAALFTGLVCFLVLGYRQGFSAKELLRMVAAGGKKSFVVLRILLLVGLITALWRSAGTIAFFVYCGISIITPHMFILIAFLLTAALSFALGTSFGVAGTVGVILMALAKSGDVSLAVTAGAIMSGAYFGDRCAPASSSATLVAAVTGTALYQNVRQMLVTGALPTVLALIIYSVLSYRNPLNIFDTALLSTLEDEFSFSLWVALPAAIMLLLPLFKVEVGRTMMCSIAASFLITIFVQRKGFWETIVLCIMGFIPSQDTLVRIMAGGGLLSMLGVVIIVLISSTYSGIFDGTGLLFGVQEKIASLAGRTGLFPAMLLTSLLTAGVFCNQTVATILNNQLLSAVYEKKGAKREELAMDIENSVVTLSGVIPWCVACAVPLEMLGAGPEAIPYSVLLILIPLCYLFTKRIWYPAKSKDSMV